MTHKLETMVVVRQRELLREAEMERLYQQARAGMAQPQQQEPFYYEALAALGRRLSDVGDYLQERYGECQSALEPALKIATHEQR